MIGRPQPRLADRSNTPLWSAARLCGCGQLCQFLPARGVLAARARRMGGAGPHPRLVRRRPAQVNTVSRHSGGASSLREMCGGGAGTAILQNERHKLALSVCVLLKLGLLHRLLFVLKFTGVKFWTEMWHIRL